MNDSTSAIHRMAGAPTMTEECERTPGAKGAAGDTTQILSCSVRLRIRSRWSSGGSLRARGHIIAVGEILRTKSLKEVRLMHGIHTRCTSFATSIRLANISISDRKTVTCSAQMSYFATISSTHIRPI